MLRNAENAESADCDPLTTSSTDAINIRDIELLLQKIDSRRIMHM